MVNRTMEIEKFLYRMTQPQPKGKKGQAKQQSFSKNKFSFFILK